MLGRGKGDGGVKAVCDREVRGRHGSRLWSAGRGALTRTLWRDLALHRKTVPTASGAPRSSVADVDTHRGSGAGLLLVATRAGAVSLHRAGPGAPVLGTHVTESPIRAAAFYPRDPGIHFVSMANGGVALCDSEVMVQAAMFSFEVGVAAHSIGLPGPEAASGLVAVGGGAGVARIIDLVSGGFTHSLNAGLGPVASVAFAPGSDTLLATGCMDGTLKLFDIRTSGVLLTLDQNVTALVDARASDAGYLPGTAHTHGVTSLAFAPSGLRLYSSGCDGAIRAWNTADGTNCLVNFECAASGRVVGARFNTLVVSDDDSTLFAPTASSSVGVYDTATGQELDALAAHFTPINALAADPDGPTGPTLVSGADSGAVLLWGHPELDPDAAAAAASSSSTAGANPDLDSDSEADSGADSEASDW